MTVAKAEHFQALQDILRLDISTCTAELCIAARKDSESLPEFRRLCLAESVKEQFRHLVLASLLTLIHMFLYARKEKQWKGKEPVR